MTAPEPPFKIKLNNMFFVVKKGTDFQDKLMDLEKRRIEVKNKSFELAKKFGSKELVPLREYAGGITSIRLDEKPEGWVKCHFHEGFYKPHSNRKTSKDAREKIKSLPFIPQNEVNELFGWQHVWLRSRTSNSCMTGPSFLTIEEFSIIQYPDYIDPKDVPIVEGMEEITRTKFDQYHQKMKDLVNERNKS